MNLCELYQIRHNNSLYYNKGNIKNNFRKRNDAIKQMRINLQNTLKCLPKEIKNLNAGTFMDKY